jgi:hypothetical protein
MCHFDEAFIMSNSPQQAADNWKIERFLSDEVLPSGNYSFEIKRNECTDSVSVIRRIRFCNETGELNKFSLVD